MCSNIRRLRSANHSPGERLIIMIIIISHRWLASRDNLITIVGIFPTFVPQGLLSQTARRRFASPVPIQDCTCTCEAGWNVRRRCEGQ